MLNEEEISETLTLKFKNFLDDFMVRATFLSYLKRNYYGGFFTTRSENIIEAICGKNYSEDIEELANEDDIDAYRKIEKFRNRRKWKKIIFRDIKRDSKGVESFSGPSIVILDNVTLLVFENVREMIDIFELGYAAPFSFFRLYQEDQKLIILYAGNAGGPPVIEWQKNALRVAGVNLAKFD
jgi:hypothetical protein